MKPPTRIQPLHPDTLLNRNRRDLARARAEAGVDVVVVGGGITGAGAALDAASRGLSVVLVEAHDLAFGTSRWSSKLVHGGLRYLAKGDVGVAWESARERAAVAGRIAPHLVRPLPQVVPDFAGSRTAARLALAGMKAGDSLKIAARTPRGLLPGARRVDAAGALELVPGLRRSGLLGAVVGWDCQLVDDARLVVAVARTAAGYGAGVLTRTRVLEVDRIGASVSVADELSGDRYTIPARWIINATGVWAGELDPEIRLTPSLGTHVVVPTGLLGHGRGSLTVPVPGHAGRFVFSLPQSGGISYIGVTDTSLSGGPVAEPSAPQSDIEWILQVVSTALERPIHPDEALGAFAGLRPLTGPTHASSADISRKHLVRTDGRMVTVTGGKLTTYRRMAQDAVDRVTDAPCRTRDIALVGAGDYPERGDIPVRLLRNYGSEAAAVWDLAAADPALRVPVAPGSEVLGVELLFGVRCEGALDSADLLQRRTRLGLLEVAPAVKHFADQVCQDELIPRQAV